MNIKRFFILISFLLLANTAAFANTGLIFTSAPSSATLDANSSTTMQFVVRNESTTQEMPIYDVNVSPTSTSSDTTSVSLSNTSCYNSSRNYSVVAPGGSCSINVEIDSKSQAGTVGHSLSITYSNSGFVLSSNFSVVVNGSSASTLQAPTSVVATPTSPSTAQITWGAASGGTPPYTYTVTATPSQGSGLPVVTKSNISSLNTTLSGLAASTTYSVIVTAVDGASQTAASSSTALNMPDEPPALSLNEVVGARNMETDGTQFIIYRVNNNASENIDITTTLTQNTLLTSSTLNNSCNNTVPSDGHCLIRVKEVAGSSTGTVNQVLSVNYQQNNEAAPTLTANIEFDIIVPSGLSFSSQPQNSVNVYPNGLGELNYVVQNTGTTAVQIDDIKVRQFPNATLFHAITTINGSSNCEANEVPAGSTCNITAYLTPQNALSADSTSVNLDISYAGSSLLASGETTVIELNQIPPLQFYFAPTGTQSLSTDNTINLEFDVQNANQYCASPSANLVTPGPVTIDNIEFLSGDSSSIATIGFADACALYLACNNQNIPSSCSGSPIGTPQSMPLPSNSCQPQGQPGGMDTPSSICSAAMAEVASSTNLGASEQFMVINYTLNSQSYQLVQYFDITVGKTLVFYAEPTPQDMAVSTSQTLNYSVRNTGTNSVTLDEICVKMNGSNQSACINPSSAQLPPTLNNVVITTGCENSIAAASNCPVTVVLNSSTETGDINDFQLSIAYDDSGNPESSSPLLSTAANFDVVTSDAPSAPLLRTFTFNNQCTFSVNVGISGGNSNNVNTPVSAGSNVNCQTNADCPKGSSCVVTNTNLSQCFWNNPSPSNGDLSIPSGGTINIDFPQYDNSNTDVPGIAWSGSLTGRLDCSDGSCAVAPCGGGGGPCLPSQAFFGSINTAEFTLNTSETTANTSNPNYLALPDFYDVTLINGIHLPMEMNPTDIPVYSTNPYYCGTAGNIVSVTGTPAGGSEVTLGACDWTSFDPSQDFFTQVSCEDCDASTQPSSCTYGTACSDGTCGLAFNPFSNTYIKRCSAFVGYTTGAQLCGASPGSLPTDVESVLKCSSNAGDTGNPNATFSNLYLCSGNGLGESCYSSGAGQGCCGCQNWDTYSPSITIPGTPVVENCVSTNSTWVDNVLPNIAWIKSSCPPVYTYQFDDPSSTFKCPDCADGGSSCVLSGNPDIGTVDYTVTFCPSGQTLQPPL